MKQYLIITLLFLSSYNLIVSQEVSKPSDIVDVLHMKDNTVIYGTIIYMIPKKQVNIRVKDRKSGEESVKTFQMNEIEQITKENISTARALQREPQSTKNETRIPAAASQVSSLGNSSQNNRFQQEFNQPLAQPVQTETQMVIQSNPSIVEKPTIVEGVSYLDGMKTGVDESDIYDMYRRLSRVQRDWNRDIKGIRVFTDYIYTEGFGKTKNNYLGWSTSIGYQNDPYFFIGIGVQYSITLNNKESTLPVFVASRINFLDNNITPFLDMKGGYSINEAKGIFLNPSFGTSFELKGTSSLDIAVGYSFQKAKWKERDKVNPIHRIRMKDEYHGLMFKVTYSITFWKF